MNFFPRVLYRRVYLVIIFQKKMTQSELSEFLDAPSAPYYYGFKASDIGQCQYKIRDDSVRPRHFFGTDNENEIEAILSDREGHSLHEYIDGDEPLRLIIDFDLLVEALNAITPSFQAVRQKIYFVAPLEILA